MTLATLSEAQADGRLAGATEDFCRDLPTLDGRRLERADFCELGARPSRAAMAWSRARRCFLSSARIRAMSKVGSPETGDIFRESADGAAKGMFLFRFPNKPRKLLENTQIHTVLANRERTRVRLVGKGGI